MPKRSITARQRRWLHDEIESWQTEGVLSPEQANAILTLYESSAEIVERRRSRAVFTLVAMASLLIGLAVLLLIGYNWEKMPTALKLIVVFSAIIGAYAGGFYLRYTRGMRMASELIFFLGCLFYGAGIWLVAQIFHIQAHFPDGVWWWAIGVLPFALCLDTLLLHALLVALLGLGAGMEVFGLESPGVWFFGTFIPNGAYTLPLFALPGFIWSYRKNSPATVGLYALLLAWWVILQQFAWRWETNALYFIAAVGSLFLLISESHEPGSRFAIPYRLWGMLMVGGALVPSSFYRFNAMAFQSSLGVGGLMQVLVILALTLGTITAALLLRRRHYGATARFSVRAVAFIRQQWLPLALVLLMVLLIVWESFVRSPGFNPAHVRRAALVPTILVNVAMIGSSLWLIAVGLREDRGWTFTAGVLYFLLWTVLRYVDLFGEFGGFLGAALMFFLCGAALLGVALYWRRRKEVRHA
jgi:uncharacterized membrane protein